MPNSLDQATRTAYHGILANAQATWLTLIDTLPAWFWACDEHYELTYMSDNLTRVTGLTPAMMQGVCVLDERYEATRENLGLGAYQDVLRAQKPFDSFCYEKLLKSGERVVLMDSGVPIFDDAGTFKGYRGVSFHLTQAVTTAGETASLIYTLKSRADELEQELSNRNAELEASNKLLNEVVDAMGQGLIVTEGTDLDDPENKVVMVNPAYHALFDVTEAEIAPGTTMQEAISMILKRSNVPKTPEVLEMVEERLKAGTPWVIDIKSSGRATSVKTARRPSGGYVIVHTDVTDLRARNMMLEQARDEAQVANHAKSNFLATMSHEIRTPMNGVVGMSDLLAATDLNAEQMGFVETIRTSALALTMLISDILDFSKIEAGHVALQNDLFDVKKVVRDTCALVEPLAHIKSLEFDVSFAPDVARAAMGDALRLRQVLLNLLGNAVKFTMDGGVRLVVQSGSQQNMIDFEVHDTGIGIPHDKVDTIFAPFQQVDGGLQREFEGTGLGLSITRTLVEAMGGVVSVQSEEGRGSIFTMSLPFEPSALSLPETTTADVGRIDCSGCHVLVAEDNRTNQLVVRRMLERTGATITLVRNGQEACVAYRDTRFDLVLMDISMPVMNGLDACIAIRKIEAARGMPQCPVVALTGNAFDRDKDACEAAGMNGFLTKPVRLTDVTQCLMRHLGDSVKTTAQIN
ncbi:MAG: signal transduction histidine kinase/CheY-like chemotaxis protein [Ascidiaceihabitans sp.]|jgi:signal transduction histidine kinase/CheY-like chemotaxis protein